MDGPRLKVSSCGTRQGEVEKSRLSMKGVTYRYDSSSVLERVIVSSGTMVPFATISFRALILDV